MIEKDNLSVIRETKGKLPSLPFVAIKNLILGKNYNLSIAFVGLKKSQELNKKYRGKNKPTNVLSFDYEKGNGEIIISLKTARHDAPLFKTTYKNFVGHLVIHAMLHLKGMQHGSTMENKEKVVMDKFGLL